MFLVTNDIFMCNWTAGASEISQSATLDTTIFLLLLAYRYNGLGWLHHMIFSQLQKQLYNYKYMFVCGSVLHEAKTQK